MNFLICFLLRPERFSQTFIDIREKERKRSQRGLVSVPPKFPKIDDDKLAAEHRNDTAENGTAAMPINRDDNPNGFKPEHLLELQEKITKEILSTKLKEDEMHELQVSEALITTMTGIKCVSALFAASFSLLQAKINHEILNSKVFNLEHQGLYGKKPRSDKISSSPNRIKSSATAKARSLMNLHNNEAGRRVTFFLPFHFTAPRAASINEPRSARSSIKSFCPL